VGVKPEKWNKGGPRNGGVHGGWGAPIGQKSTSTTEKGGMGPGAPEERRPGRGGRVQHVGRWRERIAPQTKHKTTGGTSDLPERLKRVWTVELGEGTQKGRKKASKKSVKEGGPEVFRTQGWFLLFWTLDEGKCGVFPSESEALWAGFAENGGLNSREINTGGVPVIVGKRRSLGMCKQLRDAGESGGKQMQCPSGGVLGALV